MSKVFNVAGGPIGNYVGEEEVPSMRNIEVTLKSGESNVYFLHDYFNPDTVTVKITYSDGSVNENASNYVWYPARPLEVSDEYITFKAVEGGAISETQFRITVRDYQLVDIPEYNGTLVYNGNLQFPTFDKYDTSKMRIVSGESAMSEAGTYRTTFSLTDPSTMRWNIPTDQDYFADQVVEWTIQKKPTNILVTPMGSSISYSNTLNHYLRRGDVQEFGIGYEGSPTGNFVDDISQGHIRIVNSVGFNTDIAQSNISNFILRVQFSSPGTTSFVEGTQCITTISVNPDSFPNYEYQGSFNLVFLLYDPWAFGTESDGSFADKEWFQGLSKRLTDRAYSADWVGQKKRMILNEPVLNTTEAEIVCIGASAQYVTFQFSTLLNEPLTPAYTDSGTLAEYNTSTFQQINDQLEQALPAKDYMTNIPQRIVAAGFSSNDAYIIGNKKVVTPTACELGLVVPDMDTPQDDGEEISYADYNGEIPNIYYIDDTRRQKKPGDSNMNAKYWTRSTYVKYLQVGQPKRHFVVVDENGQAMDVDATQTGLEIHHAPIFRIGTLPGTSGN